MTTKPSLIAYAAKNRGKGQNATWTGIGAAWPHSAGDGLSIELDALPVDGRLVLIPLQADDQAISADGSGRCIRPSGRPPSWRPGERW
jgi:hypothetical protein